MVLIFDGLEDFGMSLPYTVAGCLLRSVCCAHRKPAAENTRETGNSFAWFIASDLFSSIDHQKEADAKLPLGAYGIESSF
jgi:hypothetical protein